MYPHVYTLDPNITAILVDMGVEPAALLRHAELPDDLFAQETIQLSTAQYFRLWRTLESLVDDLALPTKIAETMKADAFSPPIFAAMCSPNLLVALQRIAKYKPLIGPIELIVSDRREDVSLELRWRDTSEEPPVSFVLVELTFFVQLARMGTRERIKPLRVETPVAPRDTRELDAYFGVRLRKGDAHLIRFRRADALRPFLTSNAGMWSIFEPALRKRLAELDAKATTEDRVRATLLEGLPSGETTMDAVARRLAVSKRTLQRRLSGEGTTFQSVLQQTREALATHYLERTRLSASEISFLLGYEEPNSFYRAFNSWTGASPERWRASAPTALPS